MNKYLKRTLIVILLSALLVSVPYGIGAFRLIFLSDAQRIFLSDTQRIFSVVLSATWGVVLGKIADRVLKENW